MENKVEEKATVVDPMDPHDPKNPALKIKMKHRTYWIVGVFSAVLVGTIVTAILGAVFLNQRSSSRSTSGFAYGWNNAASGSYDAAKKYRKGNSIYTFSTDEPATLTSITVEKEDAYLVFPKSNNQQSVLSLDATFNGDSSGIRGIYLPTLYADIAARSFTSLPALQEIHFGSYTNAEQSVLQNIHEYACSDNATLTSVTFASNLSSLGAYAFTNDIALTTLDFSKTSLRSLGEGAFANCTSLTNISFPSTIVSLPKNLFQGDTKLTTIHFAGSQETWSALTKEADWNAGTNLQEIICQNGTITL